MNNIIQQIEHEQMKLNLVCFRPGDLISVRIWIVEGDKKRLQVFEGIVIAMRNRGINSTFTVRKVSSNNGVERVFQKYSPNIESVQVNRKGIVRKSKLYYLRSRSGKNARIKMR